MAPQARHVIWHRDGLDAIHIAPHRIMMPTHVEVSEEEARVLRNLMRRLGTDPLQRFYEFEKGVDEDSSSEDLHNTSREEHKDISDDSNNAGDEEEPPAKPQDGPPNGGTKAWLQVLGGFMLFFNTWGILNTFGVYQTYYESGQLFTASSSTIAWIGSIQAVMVLVGGALSGPVFDRGYLRLLLILGSFGIVFGHMMLSLCTEFYQCLLAQGFCIGLGAACLFIPAVAILPTYFSSKLGLAIGVAAAGSSMGGIIYPIMFYKLIDRVGFGWSVRIVGFTALATLMIPIFCMKMRVTPPKARSIIDWTAFTDFPYMLFVFGSIVGFIGLYTGLFYTSYFGEQTKYTSESLSFYLVPILNAGSVFGRTLPNWLSDKIGPFNVIVPGAMSLGIVILCYMAVNAAAGLVVLSILFGFFSGVFVALPPVLFVALTKDKSKIGTRIGMGYTMIAAGVLAGGPGGGAILGTNVADLHWNATWTYAGVCGLASSAVFFALRIMKGGFGLRVKV